MLAAGETRQRSTIMHKAVLGFLAVDYVNGNVAPGVLANYSGAYRIARMFPVSTPAMAVRASRVRKTS